MSTAVGGVGRARVVVVGGGFARLAAVHSLRGADVDVLLLDRDAYSTFQPLLYQVATGGLNPGDISYALRAISSRVPQRPSPAGDRDRDRLGSPPTADG